MNEDKKLTPWCQDSKLLSQFVSIGQKLGFILLSKDGKGNPTIHTSPLVKPVTHKDRTYGE